MATKFTHNEMLKIFKQKHGNRFNYNKTKYINSTTKIIITCRKHGDFETYYDTHLKSDTGGCLKCRTSINMHNFKVTVDEIKQRLIGQDLAGTEPKYETYNGITNKMWFKCEKHGDWYASIGHYLNGTRCPKCNIEKRALRNQSTTALFIEKANKIHNGRYNYDKVIYKGVQIPVIITCPIHGDFLKRPNAHIGKKKQGCTICAFENNPSAQPKKQEEFIKEAKKVHNNKYKYDNVKYVNNKTKIEVICPDHGIFHVRPDLHLTVKSGCPVCSASAGEKYIFNLLKTNNINFIHQFSISGFLYKWDFYLPDLNLVIEYHGRQHLTDEHFWDYNKINKTKLVDKIKFLILKELGIRCDYIYYKEPIQNKLIQILSKYSLYIVNGKFFNTVSKLAHYLNLPNDFQISYLEKYKIKNILSNIK